MTMNTANAGVFAVKKSVFAVGLFWQTAADERSAINDIKQTAVHEGTEGDLYCLRAGERAQWAIGVNAAGHMPGHIAAAGVVADYTLQRGIDSWAAAFEMPNGMRWFTSGHSQLIDPEGDHRLPHAKALSDKIEQALADAPRQLLILPKEWTWRPPSAGYEKLEHLLFHRLPLPTNPSTLVDITLGSTFSASRMRTLAEAAARYLPFSFTRHLAARGSST